MREVGLEAQPCGAMDTSDYNIVMCNLRNESHFFSAKIT